MPAAAIVLAAGQGTRMRSDMPKVLHKLAGAPLVVHALRAAREIPVERCVVVTGHGGEAVEAAVRDADTGDVTFVRQERQLGTAHAVLQAREALADFEGDTFVLYGDTPLIRPETLAAMTRARRAGADVVVLGFHAADPTGYGRLVTDRDGTLEAIVEQNEATPEQQAIDLCNSGVIAADGPRMFTLLSEIGNDNGKGEYYLTDIVERARAHGLTAAVITCDETETLGVNARADLAAAEAAFQTRARAQAMEAGATLTDPASVWFGFDTHIGRDVSIGPNVFLGPGVTIEDGATIHAFCHLEGCRVAGGANVGPFARLRPGADLGRNTRVGNFVEIKNARIDTGAKVNHLSYVGDADIGAAANIGAGTITCNYDGVFKHRTEIGPGSFIGSNATLIAPLTLGQDAFVAAGSTVNEDVPAGALAFGRARQSNRIGLGRRLMARLRALKSGGGTH